MKLFIIISLFVIAPITILAQDFGPTYPNPGIPVDGGLSILLGAGVAYGAKKVFDKQKNDKENE